MTLEVLLRIYQGLLMTLREYQILGSTYVNTKIEHLDQRDSLHSPLIQGVMQKTGAMKNQCNKRWEYSLWVLVVIICCSIPWVVRQAYAGGRYCDGIGIIGFPMLMFMQLGAPAVELDFMEPLVPARRLALQDRKGWGNERITLEH